MFCKKDKKFKFFSLNCIYLLGGGVELYKISCCNKNNVLIFLYNVIVKKHIKYIII